jgi:hypothetical protein
MPEINLRKKNAHRTGGWGFQEDNLVLIDNDDTGIVLSALGVALDGTDDDSLPPARRQRVKDAVDLALLNLLDMQCDDGGWAAFVWNLGSKPRGPLFDKPMAMPTSLLERVRFLADAPVELGEPAVEGLTGRVLQGLGANGFGPAAAEVQRAVRFLEERQMPDGSFWARWIVGYQAATASVVSGLAACGVDLEARWIRRAIDYLLGKQNPDGGWGETVAAYERPHAGFESPSMPPLTGMVLVALVDAGLAAHPAVGRGAAYLARAQAADGSWTSNGWLQIMQPYATYYDFAGEAWYRPLEALARVRSARALRRPAPVRGRPPTSRALSRATPQPPAGLEELRARAARWDASDLRGKRRVGDLAADEVVRRALAQGGREALRDVMSSLTSARDREPAPPPPALEAFFAENAALPRWADPRRIQAGQRLFSRLGWVMAAGFFCSSLPQAYCAANGARVLTVTHGMTRNVRPRIAETAQFVFDVCAEGSMREGGPGIRAAQRVRLLHAVIRHLILAKGGWDEAELGLPINQEDLAGTLMTFSVVLLDALRTAGFEASPDDEDAFLHLWKVAGHYLGVAPALLPVDASDAREMMQAIRDDQWGPSVQGRLLASELMASMRDFVPGRLFHDVPAVLIRFFAPPAVPRLLGIDGSSSLEVVLDAGMRLGSMLGVAARDEGRRNLVRRLSRDLMVGIVGAQREARGPTFRIPDVLVRAWELGARGGA